MASGSAPPRRDIVVLAAILAAGATVAISTTSGEVYLAPSAVWLVAAAGAVAAAVAVPDRLRPAAVVAAAAIAGFAAAHVLYRDGVPRVHDLHHYTGLWAYGRAVAAGDLYPRWIPWLGFGMPLLQFYGPVNFLAALPAILAGAPPMTAWKFEVALGHVLAPLSTLLASRILGCRWRSALLAAVAAAFAPWRLAVADYRGALAEANAFATMPLAAAATLRLLRGPSSVAPVVLAVSTAALLLTHAISAFTLAIVLLPAAALTLAGGGDGTLWRRMARATIPWAIGASLSAAWWIPATAEAGATALRERTTASTYFRYEAHGVGIDESLRRREWDRVRFALTETQRRQGGEGQQMPYYCGAVLIATAIGAVGWGRSRETAALAASAALGLLLATRPAAHAAAALPGFAALQFPWRFLSPASVVAALAIAAGWESFRGDRGGTRAAWPALVLASLLIWDAAPYTGAADRIPPYEGTVHVFIPDAEWTHWDGSARLVPVRLEARDGIARVVDLMLPPADYSAPVDPVMPHYPEWLSPELYRRYFGVDDIPTVGAAGIGWALEEQRPDPIPLPAAPYASLGVSGDGAAISSVRFDRRPGLVSVDTDVPSGGARLRVLEQWFPGWVARIDGGPGLPPLDDGGFMAVELPAGRHRVELRYGLATWPRLLGLGISFGTFILFLPAFRRRWAP